MKTIIMSDIHGCYGQMKTLLEKTGFEEDKDQIIALGDMVDRGKEVYEVIEEMKRLEGSIGERCILLRGNHEQMLIESITDRAFGDSHSLWRKNGGGKTIQSLEKHGLKPKDVCGWCQSLKTYHETDQFICVHAGISPHGLHGSTLDQLIWDRSVADDGWYKGKLLIYGHTPQEEVLYQDGYGKQDTLEPGKIFRLPKTGSICIDTGCVWEGKLSALVITGNEGIVYNI